MSAKMVTIPFDLETAKKIMLGERKGSIVTKDDKCEVEIVYQDETKKSIHPILAVIHSHFGPVSDWFAEDGVGINFKLAIEVPEYTTFKDGDVLSNESGDYIFILNVHGKYLTSFYASYDQQGVIGFNIGGNRAASENNIERYRFATEEEKKKFIDALKVNKNPTARTYLKKFFGIEKYDFEPFSKVLVRDDVDEEWHISFFARMVIDKDDEEVYKFECSNGTRWNYCIPFEGNEALLTSEKTE